MSFLAHIPLTSTSQDQTVERAIAFLVTQKPSRSPTLPMVQSEQRLDGAWQQRSVLKRLRARSTGEDVRRFARLLNERMPPVGILDSLVDTEHWLNWTQHFGPLSGHEAKLDKPRERYLATAFCYGCNLGPTQSA